MLLYAAIFFNMEVAGDLFTFVSSGHWRNCSFCTSFAAWPLGHNNGLEVRPVQAMLCTKATMPEEI